MSVMVGKRVGEVPAKLSAAEVQSRRRKNMPAAKKKKLAEKIKLAQKDIKDRKEAGTFVDRRIGDPEKGWHCSVAYI
jgi:hypothetical protein